MSKRIKQNTGLMMALMASAFAIFMELVQMYG